MATPRGLHRHGAKLRAVVAMPPPDAEAVATLAQRDGVTVGEWLARLVAAEVRRRAGELPGR